MSPTYPTPLIDERTRPYWEGARAEELRLYQCLGCGRFSFPADHECSRCHSLEGEWRPVSGKGTIHSFCTFHKAYWAEFKRRLPYTVIQVRLDEGAFLYSRLIGGPPPRIDMPVRTCFEKGPENLTLVCFTAADTDH